jgi:outer membrane protein TolC
MVNFQWDLCNWKRYKNKVQQSRLEYQRLDLEEQQLLLDINNEIKEAYEQHKIILRQIEMQNRLYAQEKDRYEITHGRFQQGLTTALDLSSAEHALTSAQLQLQKSYVDWYKNNLQMQYATGQIGNLTQEVDK